VYGGGRVGLMGALADAALDAGGRVIGVIPKILYKKEVAHEGVTELRVVESMSERKAVMGQLSDAFVALPGGIGTMDELFEVWTWTQLGLQHKLAALLNVEGYFDALVQFIDHAVAQGVLKPQHRKSLLVDANAERLLDRVLIASEIATRDASHK
ncbi:MAG TPA: TIGR00730 family Rossman fold protein, partial [Steroidobacteraceae bacterium]|nr:TIGR00730 family Rossman fold protein [Steroidobacteraceae bacterium]